VVRLTEPSVSEGIEKQSVEGVTVRVYSAAKTVADCFKFRNKIGLDIAVEALKDWVHWRSLNVWALLGILAEKFSGRRFSHHSTPLLERPRAAPCGPNIVYIKLI
jgi:hypothetical protein